MPEATTIMKGQLEDHLGRILHPDSEADQIGTASGKSVETVLAELLAKFGDYVAKSGDSTIAGSLETDNGHMAAGQWLALSSGSDGHALFAQNAYRDFYANTYHYLRTHDNMGARGLIFRYGNPGIYWFDTGFAATTAGQEFTPSFKRLDKPDAELITGTDLNTLTANGVYFGQTLGNAPNTDWFWVFVENLPDNPSSYVSQYAVGVNEQANYMRTRRNGTWYPWEKILTSANTPTFHASTAAPTSSDGADGDVWDVYV